MDPAIRPHDGTENLRTYDNTEMAVRCSLIQQTQNIHRTLVSTDMDFDSDDVLLSLLLKALKGGLICTSVVNGCRDAWQQG